jgi:hypothetical protein
MKGWQIFMHSLRQVFNNLEGALRVSAVLYVGQAVLGLLLLQTVSPWGESANPDGMRTMMMAGDFPWVSLIVVVLVAVICNLWIAVGWHRYVLTNEKPALLPALLGDRMWAYFLRGLMIGLILIPVFIVVGLVVGVLAAAGGPPLAAIAAVALAVPVWITGLRMSASLPGVALGVETGIGQAWNATKEDMGAFVALAVILAVLSFAVALVGTLAFQAIGLGLVWDFVFGWVQLMVGVSILTTLYGHYIEKRPLM